MSPSRPCCSFLCPEADNARAQHAACLAVNGVYCGKLRRVIEKGAPCPLSKPAPLEKRKKRTHPKQAR
ncbi:MAG: hypothetical protein MUF69_09740 [Desulfobacterota bacterium]|nr:hypothetical protein [Thermodesulfobacteriota bacterium]